MTITFDKGAVYGDKQCYLVAISDDTVVEDDEVFFVTLTSNEPAYFESSLTQATVTIHHDPADCKWSICFGYFNIIIILYTVVELGFQQTNYSISEQVSLRDAMICVVINSGNLEREIAVNLTVTDGTAEGR